MLTFDTGDSIWKYGSADLYCLIGPGWQHTGVDHDSVLAYGIFFSENIMIDGSAYDGNMSGTGTDGVQARILRYSVSSGIGTTSVLRDWTTIPDHTPSTSPVDLALSGPIHVDAGDWIFFQLNKGANNGSDQTYWNPRISFGRPFDSDTNSSGIFVPDLLPDYLEDANGDGVTNNGETNWLTYDADGDNWSDLDERIYGTNENLADTDGDGVNYYAELVQGTNPNDGTNSIPMLLGDWRFNIAGSLTNEQGVAPLNGAYASLTPSYEGWAVIFGTNATTTNVLRYPIASATRTNLDLGWGTVRFTYVPDWYFGHTTDAPGQICRLLECGQWQLSLSADGRYLTFQTPAPDGTTTRNFTALLPRSTTATTNRTAWEIELGYCRGFTSVKIDNQTANDYYTSGPLGSGVLAVPPAGVSTNGFCVGSAADGSAGARGYLDQLTTYNALLQSVQFGYNGVLSSTTFGTQWDWVIRRGQFLTATDATNGLDLHWLRSWEGDPAANAGTYSLERQTVGQTNWTVVATNLFTETWRDTTAAAGAYYNYQLDRGLSHTQPTTTAVWRAAPIEARGKAILLVDNSLTNDLSADLNTFTNDLIGDGWQVAFYAVPRHTNTFWDAGTVNLYYTNNLWANRTIISNEWRLNTNGTNVVILLGHVTVPYSGFAAEDGHFGAVGSIPPNHEGAWPADAWYGDVDGDWGDTQSNTSPNAIFQNLPGDGKWDRINALVTTNLTFELPVGRIDFDNMPTFIGVVGSWSNTASAELGLLKRYLAKDHAYRRGDYTFDPSLRVFAENNNFSQMTVNARPVAAHFFSNELINQSSAEAFRLGSVNRPSTFWAFHGGYGYYNSVQGIGGTNRTSTEIASQYRIGDFAFGILSGSYFADWNATKDGNGVNTPDNLLKSCLAQQTNGFAAMWGFSDKNGPWSFSDQAEGVHLGTALPKLLNGAVNGHLQSVRTSFILGDPTLRMAQIKPGGTPMATAGGGGVILSWSASGTSGAGYWVYSATNLTNPNWSKLTTGEPLLSLSYTNIGASGTNCYMIRAVALQVTGSGSYTNLSQGTITTYP